jgi:Holin of 3TMs, for gene-transfer release
MAFDPISAVSGLVNTVVSKIFPDANKKLDVQEAKDAAVAAIKEMQVSGELQQVLGQLQINTEEAKSSSIFVAGWRPWIGWVCGAAFAWQFVVGPIGEWIVALYGHPTQIPTLDMATMMPVLLGMLGLGAMRSYDKKNGNGK